MGALRSTWAGQSQGWTAVLTPLVVAIDGVRQSSEASRFGPLGDASACDKCKVMRGMLLLLQLLLYDGHVPSHLAYALLMLETKAHDRRRIRFIASITLYPMATDFFS